MLNKKKIFLCEGTNWYNQEQHGDLEKYFEVYNGISAFPLFKGTKHFKMLWDQGYIEPGITTIRVMWNMGRDDEHFDIVDENTLEGIAAPAHSGRSGRHSINILDKCPSYEIHYPLTKRRREYLAKKQQENV
jgi:hypothetical protein